MRKISKLLNVGPCWVEIGWFPGEDFRLWGIDVGIPLQGIYDLVILRLQVAQAILEIGYNHYWEGKAA